VLLPAAIAVAVFVGSGRIARKETEFLIGATDANDIWFFLICEVESERTYSSMGDGEEIGSDACFFRC
jgi:hypothetical protein